MKLKFKSEHTYIPVEDTRRENATTVVYEALDTEYERRVFIKEVPIVGTNPREKKNALNQAILEVKAMMQVEEATCFIPRIYECFFDEQKSVLYIVMQLIRGKSLREAMKTASPMMMINWMVFLCDILKALESKKLQNKDVKPENIITVSNELLFLIDFDISISVPKLNVGTKCYRAPEMERRDNFHEMSRNKVDIFAVGVILYEYFGGSLPRDGIDYDMSPFGDGKAWDTFISPKEKNPSVPETVNNIIVRCMKLRPEDRYRNAADLKRDLMVARQMMGRRKPGK